MSTTLPYSPPSVGPSGLVVSTYQSILNDNLQAFLNIYGQNQYIAPDSAIYQLLSIISLKQSDANLGLQLAYNQSSPQTAVGAGLDRVLKMNGLERAAFSYSVAQLVCAGTPGQIVTNGVAQDQSGNLWALPSSFTIVGGSITVTATCTTPGNVVAEANQINIISTPQSGWATVNNPSAATPGVPVQSDSQVRAVQAVSVALPSLTTLQSTLAAILSVPGVTRVNPGTPTPGGPGSSIENPTGTTDSWGNPAHSISMVVEGGVDLAVATAIYGARGIGCFTNGTTSVPVVDPNTGYTMDIGFFRPTYLQVCVLIKLTKLAGYSSAVGSAVQQGEVNYLNSLSIGENVVYSELYGAALTARPNPDQPLFSITSLQSGTLAAQTTAATSAGTDTVTATSAAGIAVGQLVIDYTTTGNVPDGTTVAGVSGTTVTLSNNCVATQAADTLAFFTLGTVDLVTAFTEAAEGATANVVVVAA